MSGPSGYEPPRVVLFQAPGGFLAFGWSCGTGGAPSTATCSSGWLAINNCGSGCENMGSSGCATGYTAKKSCGTGVSNPPSDYCSSYPACCSGISGYCGTGSGPNPSVTSCTSGNSAVVACSSGTNPYNCSDCLTKLCNPPS